MKKNLIAKVLLVGLLCASAVPALAGSHYKTLKLNNQPLMAGQQQTQFGYREKRKDDKKISVLATKLTNTSKVDFIVKDSKGNVVKDWKKIGQYAYWQGWSLQEVNGVAIEKGCKIDAELRNHFMSKKTAYITGELDTY